MAYPTLTMRKIREVLRLHFDCGFRQREIARAVGASPTTVGQYVRRMERAGLSWEVSATLSDDELEARLYPPPPQVEGRRPEPHWPTVLRELSRKGVTLDLLWNEYKAEHLDGYAYTWFCTHYSQWANSLPLTLRQTHAPGEKLFVDYSGDRVAIVDAATGEIREAELQKAESLLGRLDESQRRAVEAVTAQIVNKLLHLPTVRMKQAAAAADGVLYAETVRHLFGLGEGER